MNSSEAARGHDVLYTHTYIYIRSARKTKTAFFSPFFFHFLFITEQQCTAAPSLLLFFFFFG